MTVVMIVSCCFGHPKSQLWVGFTSGLEGSIERAQQESKNRIRGGSEYRWGDE